MVDSLIFVTSVVVFNAVTYNNFVQKFRQQYLKEKESQGRPSAEIQFAYAWCLVRSKQTSDLRLGTQLLEGNTFNRYKSILREMKWH